MKSAFRCLPLAGALYAQTAAPPPVVSPEVHTDHSVTFRIYQPNAKEVRLTSEGLGQPPPLQRDEQGIWSVTTEPLPAKMRARGSCKAGRKSSLTI
jgi:enterochelin esterase family protein